MHITARGPYTLTAIHCFTSNSGNMVRSLTISDVNLNELHLTCASERELRTLAAAFPFAGYVSLALSLGETPMRDPQTIRRWINGDDVVAAPIAVGAE